MEVCDVEGRPVAVKTLQLKQKEFNGGAEYLFDFDAQIVALTALRNPLLVEVILIYVLKK
jgi:hypothetical protein